MEDHQASSLLQQGGRDMSPLSGRKNIHHVCGQNEITEQKDRNHAKVQAQGKTTVKIQIMAIFKKE